jgi:hypothetical protein
MYVVSNTLLSGVKFNPGGASSSQDANAKILNAIICNALMLFILFNIFIFLFFKN